MLDSTGNLDAMAEMSDFLDEREQFELQYQQELEMLEEDHNAQVMTGKTPSAICI